jgi:hypothetical protein
MPEAAKQEKKVPPKGGRRGGTLFPKINLQKALEYSKKLVAKTHVARQPADEILPGVFGNSGPEGQVRASALKQFGLMEGDAKGYTSSKLARDIDAALPEERSALLHRAVKTSKAFDKIFDTFHGDTVSKAQIAKRGKELGVHPASADECAQIFIDSAITSGLGAASGENLVLINAGAVVTPASATSVADHPEAGQGEEHADEEEREEALPEEAHQQQATRVSTPSRTQTDGMPNADVRVSLTVDSSSDPDKLERQLKLLKQFGLLRP